MKRLLKSYSLQSDSIYFFIKNKKVTYIFLFFTLFISVSNSQIINYVNNGGFEDLRDCITPQNNNKLKYWSSIDTTKFSYYILNKCFNNMPGPSMDFQYPKSGNGFIAGTFLCGGLCDTIHNRSYFRNKLKKSLITNQEYCVRFFVNLRNSSPYGIDAIGAYFGNTSLDTIKYCDTKITYLTPQVQNISGNVITDTLNWTPIYGTFIATGSEKFLVIGNFISDNNIIKTQVLPSNSIWSDIYIDNVSCIELNLPAYAGRDTSIFLGDSVFLGSKPDVGIDEVCQWYKLPVVITPTTPAIDTVAGFWVKPIATSTYVVRQEICGLVKWDTVVVYMDAVGIEKFNLIKNDLKLFPNPAQDILQIQFTVDVENEFKTICIYNKLGQLLREEDLIFKNKTASIKTDDLRNGVYVLKLHSMSLQTVSRRFIINR